MAGWRKLNYRELVSRISEPTPAAVKTMPPINSQMDFSVGELVKKREKSELTESEA